jgi:HD-GYP domain-containing protein (c-di-GMP phosphodiesterase class II)
MKNLSITYLKPGMKFTENVYIDGEYLLVPQGLPLKEKDISRLKKWGVSMVKTAGKIIKEEAKPVAENPVVHLWEQGNTSKAFKVYTDSVQRVRGILQKIEERKFISHDEIDTLVGNLTDTVYENTQEMIRFILSSEKAGRKPSKSAVDCTILSIVIGKNMDLQRHKVLQLATGALLHDVGMVRVPDEIRNKDGQLLSSEVEKIQDHPNYSYQIIMREIKYQESVGVIAQQHHERWDGEGYPRGLAGEEINMLARIVSVADAFEAMVSERPYRNSMIGYTAMKHILSDNSRRFDPEILKVFIKSMGIYPIGSIVLLNNSSIGRVIETHPEAPLRPRIRLLIDEEGNEYPESKVIEIDLLDDKRLFIAKAINPNDFGKSVQKQ